MNRAFTLALAIFVFPADPIPAQQPTGREVMEMFKAQDRTNDLSMQETMTLVRGQRERIRELTLETRTDAGDNRKLLIRFLSPADIRGTGFLSIEHDDRDDDRWLYLPALRKTRRIAGSEKTDEFVGSEFTFEDLDSEILDLHRYTLVGSDSVGGVEAWMVEAVATDQRRSEETGYAKRELWIDKDRYVVLQVRYYDREGAYVKRFLAEDIRRVPGSEKWRPYRMTMEDVRDGDRTVIDVAEYRIDTGISDDLFSERYLKRWR